LIRLRFCLHQSFFHSAYFRIAYTKLLIYPLSILPSKAHTRFFIEVASPLSQTTTQCSDYRQLCLAEPASTDF